MANEPIRKRRERIALDHFHGEVVQRWDDVLSTFPHPHYEIIPLMTVYDGDEAVRQYYSDSRTSFPDQDHELISFRHADDAVITEFWLKGTHKGPLAGIPPTGARFRVRMTAFFIFDENDNIVCERIYFDLLTMLKQLLAGINFKNPMNWPFLFKVLKGLSKSSGAPAPSLLNTTSPAFPDYQHRPMSERG